VEGVVEDLVRRWRIGSNRPGWVILGYRTGRIEQERAR
jgi:hypothetical protein